MNSGDRSVVACFVSACLLIAFLIFTIASCSIKEDMLSAPQHMLEARSEHMQKMACIQQRGKWVPRDNDGNGPFVCKV